MAVAGRLTTQITADASGFVQGLSSAKSELKRFADDAKKAQSGGGWARAGNIRGALDDVLTGGKIGAIGKVGIGVFAIHEAGKLAGDAWAWAKETAQESKEIVNAAKRMGIGTEEFERLDKAAKKVGVDVGVMGDSFHKLQARIGRAKLGGADAGLFRSLGLDANELGRLSRADAMKEVAGAFNRIEDDSVRAAMAMQLFGRAGADVDAVMKELANNPPPVVMSAESRKAWAQGAVNLDTAKIGVNEVLGRGIVSAGNIISGALAMLGFGGPPDVTAAWQEEVDSREFADRSGGMGIATAATATFGSKESVEAVLGAGVARTNDLLAAIVANTTPQEAE
jgi:hypothetical protein